MEAGALFRLLLISITQEVKNPPFDFQKDDKLLKALNEKA
jgi:hypothetical protein